MSELKPCECGGELSFGFFSLFDPAVHVFCKNCDTTGTWADTEEEAIEAWNERVTEARA